MAFESARLQSFCAYSARTLAGTGSVAAGVAVSSVVAAGDGLALALSDGLLDGVAEVDGSGLGEAFGNNARDITRCWPGMVLELGSEPPEKGFAPGAAPAPAGRDTV